MIHGDKPVQIEISDDVIISLGGIIDISMNHDVTPYEIPEYRGPYPLRISEVNTLESDLPGEGIFKAHKFRGVTAGNAEYTMTLLQQDPTDLKAHPSGTTCYYIVHILFIFPVRVRLIDVTNFILRGILKS